MELSNTRIVPAPPSVVWAALNDPAILKDCLPGCESLEPTGEHAWRVVMAARVGPVSARFNGRMTMTDIDAPDAYTLQFDGQGGAAGFAQGEARVTLAPDGDAHGHDVRCQGAGRRQARADRLAARRRCRGEAGRRFLRALRRARQRRSGDAGGRGGDDAESRGAADADALTGSASTEASAAGMTPRDAPPQGSTPLAPAGGAPWIRYAAIIAIAVVLIVLYVRGYR